MISRRSRGLSMGKVLGFFILFFFLGFSGYAYAQTAEDYFQQGKISFRIPITEQLLIQIFNLPLLWIQITRALIFFMP